MVLLFVSVFRGPSLPPFLECAILLKKSVVTVKLARLCLLDHLLLLDATACKGDVGVFFSAHLSSAHLSSALLVQELLACVKKKTKNLFSLGFHHHLPAPEEAIILGSDKCWGMSRVQS